MPTVAVSAQTSPSPRPLKAYLVNNDGTLRVELPWAPQSTTLDGAAAEVTTVARPARKPLPKVNSDGLLTLSMSLTLGTTDIEQPCETAIKALQALARGKPVRFSYGADASAAGWWLISGLSITSSARAEATNAITRATAEVTLTEFVAPVLKIGATSTRGPSMPKKPPATYVVKRGDTLFKIAVKVYGKGNLWKRIAKANGVKDPKNLRVGRRLRIPKA